MAKKTNTTNASAGRLTTRLFEESFPTIARWISTEEGWVELGADGYSHSLARALHGGGTVWEGTDEYESLDDALRAMDEGIAAWLAENRLDPKPKGKSSALKPKTSRRQPKAEKPTKPQSEALKKGSRTVSTNHGDDKPAETKSADRPDKAAIAKARKLADIAEALHQGKSFSITRLTILKALCQDPSAARSFALFLVEQVRQNPDPKKDAKRHRELIEKAESELIAYLDDPAEERKPRLRTLVTEMRQEQNEHRNISWTMVRIIHSPNLLVAENALNSIVQDHEAPFWLYHAARDYTERYDSSHGTGLIPSSAPMMTRIADFWLDHFGIER